MGRGVAQLPPAREYAAKFVGYFYWFLVAATNDSMD
jgi:hypothetical protein